MKIVRVVLCLSLLALLALPTGAYALSVGNPSKSGSVIIFPLVDLTADNDTVISISQEMYYDVNVFCQYRTESDEVGGSVFTIGPRETVWFSLKTGDGSIPAPFTLSERGEVKCWAVNDAGSEQISWNYLQGYAEIFNAVGYWAYSSWNFAADQPRGASVGEPGEIRLTGLPGGYDAMPKYLRFSVSGKVTEATVSLVLGKQDMRQDHDNNYSKAKFSYTKYGTTSTYCLKDLGQTSIRKSVLGAFRVQGVASTVCDVQFGLPAKTTKNSPLLGVLQIKRNGSHSAVLPVGMGADGSGYILWDPDSYYEEEKATR